MEAKKQNKMPFTPVLRGGGRLDDLSDDLLRCIISFLPTNEAMLTSKLSRWWRHLCTHLPALDLQDSRFQIAGRFPGFAEAAVSRLAAAGPLRSLSVHVHMPRNVPDAHTAWFRRLIRAAERVDGSVDITVHRMTSGLDFPRCARARELAVGLGSELCQLRLPSPSGPATFGVLSSLQLTCLKLSGACTLGEFLSSCCPRLRKLRITSVTGEPVRSLVLRTDALEELDVGGVLGMTRLEAVSASLRVLRLRDCFLLKPGVVKISAAGLDTIHWINSHRAHLSFDGTVSRVRRLKVGSLISARGHDGLLDDGGYFVDLLKTCPSATHVEVGYWHNQINDSGKFSMKTWYRRCDTHPMAASLVSLLAPCQDNYVVFERVEGYEQRPCSLSGFFSGTVGNRDKLSSLHRLRDVEIRGFDGADVQMQLTSLLIGRELEECVYAYYDATATESFRGSVLDGALVFEPVVEGKQVLL